MKRKSVVFITMVLVSLIFVFASESGQKLVDVNDIQDLDSSKKPVDSPKLTKFDGQGVKPDIDFGKIPLYFIFNKGQVKGKAKFYSKASRYTLGMTKEALVFDSVRKVEEGEQTTDDRRQMTDYSTQPSKFLRDVSRLVFLDANKNPGMIPIKETPLKVNYFIGNDKSKWHCDIPTSMAVLYKNLYKNIDLKVYGIEKQIEYDWIVKPGGNPLDIRFEYKNIKGTRIDDKGNLLIETDFGELMHKKPVSYQTRKAKIEGVGAGLRACPKERKYVNVTFKKIAENTYVFEVGAYDRSRELIIDPVVLAYSTYLGGGNWEEGSGIAVDGSGSAYVTGHTDSTDFPTLNQYQADQGNWDAFVTKLSIVAPPTVDTSTSSAVTYTTATLGGNVSSTNGANVTERGVFWSTINGFTPPGQGTKVSETGNWGTGAFTVNVTGLPAGTTIYFKAFATNTAGTGYSAQASFTTPAITAPTVTTTAISNITSTSADRGGKVTSDGGAAITARGVCWSTSPNPTTAHNKTTNGTGTGTFTSNITGLMENTTYYLRAYATNAAGTGYGNQVSFTTSAGSLTVTITEPQNNARVSGTVTIKATVTSNWAKALDASILAVEKVEFYVDDANLTTGPQTLLINNSGGGTLNWTVSEDAQWLTCTPEAGTGPGAVTVSADPSVLSAGTYNATITVSDANASNSPQTVPVALKVYNPGTTTIPFGYFETPVDNSTVMSSIPVTGWALDDIDITSVKIYRAPIPGHETGGMVYIGDAVMVDGARPDVEQQFPDYPKNYQAGWGYMMLTNFLPNPGNRTFTLYAKAVDKEGNEVMLGNKIITCDNANAVKPFGAIDTPDQGGTASGSAYVNFGWVLTPQPNTIPTDGSTINVWVDGVPLGSPVYNKYRPDIATLLPDYNNSNGAGGYFYLDTTAYMNGVHTISWSAEDNAGNQDGIGSRYFTIVNVNVNTSTLSTVNSINHHPGKQQMHISNSILQQAQISYEPVVVKKGYDRDAFGQALYPDKTSIITIGLKEDERVEIVLSPVSAPGSTTTGYMMLGKQRLLLPVGSTLDSTTGIFSWQPGTGFFGLYRFVFAEKSNSGKVTRKFVNVVIKPKY